MEQLRALRVSRFKCAFLGLFLAVLPGVASASPDAGATDGGVRQCAASSDCALPTPYCDAAKGRCVECVGDKNCGDGKVCNLATETCTGCRSDGDCAPDAPFCRSDLGRCVECLSTNQCGGGGLKCTTDGACGSCGDGICSPKEKINIGFSSGGGFNPLDPFPGATSEPTDPSCAADCAASCPGKNVGSSFGSFVVPETALVDHYTVLCTGSDFPEATFGWTAPKDGTFYFSTPVADGGQNNFAVLFGGCTGQLTSCSNYDPVQLTAGQSVVLVVEAAVPGDVGIEISDQEPCFGGGCGPGNVSGDASTAEDQGKTECLAKAKQRGEDVCAGTTCVCSHCPQDYDDCAVVPGCGDVQDCMRQKACIGTDCYTSGACRAEIDSVGGVSGAAFRAAAGVQSCSLTFTCELPCGATDGGASLNDAGRLCAPGRTVACSCDGVSGTKTCASDGNAFGACSCGAPPRASAKGGCDCNVAGAGPSGTSGAFAAFVALVAFGRRRKNRTMLKQASS